MYEVTISILLHVHLRVVRTLTELHLKWEGLTIIRQLLDVSAGTDVNKVHQKRMKADSPNSWVPIQRLDSPKEVLWSVGWACTSSQNEMVEPETKNNCTFRQWHLPTCKVKRNQVYYQAVALKSGYVLLYFTVHIITFHVNTWWTNGK